MNGEIDLELYTISIIALNNALEKPDDSKDSFKEIADNLQDFYDDVIDDLNQEEVQMNDYYLFFENGKRTFPQYIETLKEISNEYNKDSIDTLINVFENLNRISAAFPAQDMVQ